MCTISAHHHCNRYGNPGHASSCTLGPRLHLKSLPHVPAAGSKLPRKESAADVDVSGLASRPPELAALLLRMLRPKPELRPSAADVLTIVQQHSGLPADDLQPPVPPAVAATQHAAWPQKAPRLPPLPPPPSSTTRALQTSPFEVAAQNPVVESSRTAASRQSPEELVISSRSPYNSPPVLPRRTEKGEEGFSFNVVVGTGEEGEGIEGHGSRGGRAKVEGGSRSPALHGPIRVSRSAQMAQQAQQQQQQQQQQHPTKWVPSLSPLISEGSVPTPSSEPPTSGSGGRPSGSRPPLASAGSSGALRGGASRKVGGHAAAAVAAAGGASMSLVIPAWNPPTLQHTGSQQMAAATGMQTHRTTESNKDTFRLRRRDLRSPKSDMDLGERVDWPVDAVMGFFRYRLAGKVCFSHENLQRTPGEGGLATAWPPPPPPPPPPPS